MKKKHPIDRQLKGILTSGQPKLSSDQETENIRGLRPAPRNYVITKEQEEIRCQIIAKFKQL